ncbi:MAG: DUF4330 domain-containing protein [Defluviitaleaceae bacterium]|nr:DUF4330 domain-containing protein [Defluviitaleaceae bacterium]
MIDKNGKLFGRISIIDILILVAVLALGIGFAFRQTSEQLGTVLNANEPFYIVLETNRVRGVAFESLEIGDMVFRLHGRDPMGTVVDIEVHPATQIMRLTDGTAIVAEMEDRYRVVITLESRGSITNTGYFVNGIDHIASGMEVVAVTNMMYLPTVTAYYVGRERP